MISGQLVQKIYLKIVLNLSELNAKAIVNVQAPVIATAATLFIVGSIRSFVTARSWFSSGLEMLFVGGIAATVAFAVGAAVKSVFGISV